MSEFTILAIDDDPTVLAVLKQWLRPHYLLRTATSGEQGLALARREPLPDLILLDVQLPDRHGYDVCVSLKSMAETAEIPVIFLTSHTNTENVTHGFGLGAVDYVSKPVNPPILLARIQTQLRLCEASALLRDQNLHLEHLVKVRTRALEARTEELHHSQELTIIALGSIAETRDNETGNHIHRTRAYVELMTHRFAAMDRHRNVSPEEWRSIVRAAPLHDIGKVGIPDQILLKPGKLTPEEFAVMKRHPAIGRDALLAAESRLGAGRTLLGTAMEIAYSHHERWDGKGYPQGLSGEEIPLSARLMAVADVYDALISARVYKPAMPHQQALEIIREGRGSHFDPAVTDCFLRNAGGFAEIARRYNDTPDDLPVDAPVAKPDDTPHNKPNEPPARMEECCHG